MAVGRLELHSSSDSLFSFVKTKQNTLETFQASIVWKLTRRNIYFDPLPWKTCALSKQC